MAPWDGNFTTKNTNRSWQRQDSIPHLPEVVDMPDKLPKKFSGPLAGDPKRVNPSHCPFKCTFWLGVQFWTWLGHMHSQLNYTETWSSTFYSNVEFIYSVFGGIAKVYSHWRAIDMNLANIEEYWAPWICIHNWVAANNCQELRRWFETTTT
jgi:hypothetical protein